MLPKKWNIAPKPSKQEVSDLMRAINASEPLASLLVQRGIKDFASAKAYFNPHLSQLHDPFLMKDMEKAVTRITAAVNANENILIYGDYDVDGTTAVSLLYDFLITQTEYVTYYIPDRYREGYGISMAGIEFARDNDIKLLIALDCGVKAIDQVRQANDCGIDVIVCDHHLPGENLPDTTALLNPLQPGCSYPYKSLCGCGIGFKLTQALTNAWNLEPQLPFKNIDLVAIASAADIVPMTGENRVLTYFGMRLMEKTLRPGLAQLLEGAGLAEDGLLSKKEMTVSDLVFKVGPRINAAGRMKHGSLAVDLLTAHTTKQAEKFAKEVNQNNSERREVDLQTMEEALEMLRNDPHVENKNSTVLFAEHWHKGVIGIAASRIQEHYYKPTIILTESNGKASGSARSVRDFDVHAAIEKCADLLVSFGGHPAAAGMTLELENINEFTHRFEHAVTSLIKPEQLIPSIEIDLEIDFSDITDNFFAQLSRIAPFGPKNMRPVFVTRQVFDTGKSRCVGSEASHLKLEVYQQGSRQLIKSGIGFGLGHLLNKMQQAKPFSLVYTLDLNDFRGLKTIQLEVRDIRFND